MEDCFLYDTCNHATCEDTFCVKQVKLKYLYDCALIPEARRKRKVLVLDNDNADYDAFTKLKYIEEHVCDFINKGRTLYIHSTIAGNGKTSWAIRLLQTYLAKTWLTNDLECAALFINVPSYLLAIKANITNPSEEVKYIQENILNANIVVFDDIGTKAATSFEHENLLSMIDTRINNGKCNIFTSNLNDEELHEVLGDRLASRICNTPYNIELKGKDKRGLI